MAPEGLKKILIADDNPDMIFLLRKGFEGEGYRIIEAHDGDETMKMMLDERPDLVLLDLKMPGRSGFEVLKEMRESEELKDIPVIVLTVVSDTGEKIKALECGANDFLVKPPITPELKARVNTQLKLRSTSETLKNYTEHLERVVESNTKELRKYANDLERMVEEKVGIIRRQNEEHLMEIKSARRIQFSFLPTKMPAIEGVEFLAKYVPCQRIGGDFYDVFRIDEHTIGFFIADVSGHGVPSAMITIFLKQEVAFLAKKVIKEGEYTVTRPREVLASLNRSFLMNNIGEGTFFITIVYCTFDIEKCVLTCSLAGHHALPLLKRSDGSVECIDMSGFPIGWFTNSGEYPERRYILRQGDTLLLYTDGLFELLLNRDSPGRDKGALDQVIELFALNNFEERCEDLLSEFMTGNRSLKDDFAMILMHLRQPCAYRRG
ncbi:MAG: SpoIIE family protein phosphatase [Spirochaetota bacterium]